MTRTREQGGDSRLCSVAYLNVVYELDQEAVGLEEQKNQGECHLPMCPSNHLCV